MWGYQDGLGWLLATGILMMAVGHAPGGALGRLTSADWRAAMQQVGQALDRAAICSEDPSVCIELYEASR